MPDDAESDPDRSAVALVPVKVRAPTLAGLDGGDPERVARYMERASADGTFRAYRSEWKIFAAWCDTRGLTSLPAIPETAAAFLTVLADAGRTRRSADGLRLSFSRTAWPGRRRRPSRSATCFSITRCVASAAPGASDHRPRSALQTATSCATCCGRSRATASARSATERCSRSGWAASSGASRSSNCQRASISSCPVPRAKSDQEGRGAIVVILDRRIAPLAYTGHGSKLPRSTQGRCSAS